MSKEIQAVLTIAFRDFTKLLRDRPRIIVTFMFPFLFIGVLGGSLESNLGGAIGFNFLTFVFTGVIGQTLFQSTSAGVISLIEDRENDFSQEIFVSPISRYTIIIGKIIGETMVSMTQALGIILIGLLFGVGLGLLDVARLFPVAIAASLLGGSFGVLVLANLGSQRTANQIFPLIIFPQFFLAGVFNPIKELPTYLYFISRIAPMTYAVDLVRGVFYLGKPEYDAVVLHSPLLNLLVMAGMFVLFLVVGTFLFVRNERNR